jgi:hypothetical protein
MSDKNWYEDLVNKYPRIFKKIKHLECGSGWETLLDCLCSDIENHLKQIEYRINNPSNLGNEYYQDSISSQEQLDAIYAVQIKEKFGGLRFYMNGVDDYISGAIAMAESISNHTCEVCGAPGKNKPVGSWYTTLCDLHRQEAEKKRIERFSESLSK